MIKFNKYSKISFFDETWHYRLASFYSDCDETSNFCDYALHVVSGAAKLILVFAIAAIGLITPLGGILGWATSSLFMLTFLTPDKLTFLGFVIYGLISFVFAIAYIAHKDKNDVIPEKIAGMFAVVSGLYGAASRKWCTQIELIGKDK